MVPFVSPRACFAIRSFFGAGWAAPGGPEDRSERRGAKRFICPGNFRGPRSHPDLLNDRSQACLLFFAEAVRSTLGKNSVVSKAFRPSVATFLFLFAVFVCLRWCDAGPEANCPGRSEAIGQP